MKPSEIRVGGRVKINDSDLEGFIKSRKLQVALYENVLCCLINISTCNGWDYYTRLHNVERMY